MSTALEQSQTVGEAYNNNTCDYVRHDFCIAGS